ncbi:hypothetical protein NON08_06745 [Cetobacterium somerae]|uniref:hypothetical protein n=1 Tax=Cetobacterium sp. NK01 TaxID=2993530 RepID=UPI0021168392|nr:hypothetical protein [Cetobacterium sp. NK01]MCQ8212223.1 hypothetical protein [Cetobacterium sp. NK01]
MKKLLAMLALSLAMVACGEKQDAVPNDPNPPVQTTDLAQPAEASNTQATDSASQPVEAIEETVVEEVTPATPAEIKAAEEAASKPGVQAVEETVEEQVQEVAPETKPAQ